MQNVLPMTPGNPLRNVTGLARQIALPGEHVPLRFPSFPALERTAVMGFNQPATLSIPIGRLTALTVFRQAAYPVWADQLCSVFYAADYPLQPNQLYTSPASADITLLPKTAVGSWTVAARSAGTTTPGFVITAPTGNNAYLSLTWPIFGADQGLEYVFVPSGCNWYVQVASNISLTAGFAAQATVEVWNSPGETNTFTVGMNANAATRGAMSAGTGAGGGTWVRLLSVSLFPNTTGSTGTNFTATIVVANGTATYAGTSTDGGTITVAAPTDAYMHVPLVGPNEFSNSTLPWYATRVTAAAMLGTNVTQVLNKGGTVLAGRVSPAVQNAWSITSSYVNALHPAEKAFLPLETGVYTYCPPSTDLVFFGDYTLNTSAGASSAPLFRLDNDSLYNKIYLSPGSVAESLAVTSTWHIEFRTSSALFQIGLSAMTLESLHQAQLVLAESGFFFENPEHDALLNRVINTAKKYAPAVVGSINPIAGRMLQSVISKMNGKVVKPKPGPSMPASTTAAKSGMLSGGKPKQKPQAKPKPQGKKGKGKR